MKEKLEKNAYFKTTDEEFSKFESLKEEADKGLSNITGLEDIKPLTFPFITYQSEFREDVVFEQIDTQIALKNTKEIYNDQIKVPKVVE